MADGREFDLFDPINELVRAQPRLVRDTVVIGGAAMMDWLLASQARDPGAMPAAVPRSTKDLDIVIVSTTDNGWREALTAAGWTMDRTQSFRWSLREEGGEPRCSIDLLGQHAVGGRGGSTSQLDDYWRSTKEGAYVCEVLMAFAGKDRYPAAIAEPFFHQTMAEMQWVRLNHLGIFLSKCAAVAGVAAHGDPEHRDDPDASRIGKDSDDLRTLLGGSAGRMLSAWYSRNQFQSLPEPNRRAFLGMMGELRIRVNGPDPGPHIPPARVAPLRDALADFPPWLLREMDQSGPAK